VIRETAQISPPTLESTKDPAESRFATCFTFAVPQTPKRARQAVGLCHLARAFAVCMSQGVTSASRSRTSSPQSHGFIFTHTRSTTAHAATFVRLPVSANSCYTQGPLTEHWLGRAALIAIGPRYIIRTPGKLLSAMLRKSLRVHVILMLDLYTKIPPLPVHPHPFH
jgi:hypothetical protein